MPTPESVAGRPSGKSCRGAFTSRPGCVQASVVSFSAPFDEMLSGGSGDCEPGGVPHSGFVPCGPAPPGPCGGSGAAREVLSCRLLWSRRGGREEGAGGAGGGGGRGGLRYSPSKEGGEPCSERLLRAYRAFPYLTFVVPQLLGVIETFVSFLKIMTVCPPTKCTMLNVHLFVYIFREFRASPPWTYFNFPSHPVR